MKIAVIIETKEHEKVSNAFRFAIAAKKLCHQTKILLFGEAVECEGLTDEKYNVHEQFRNYVNEGGEIFTCDTSLKSSQLDNKEVYAISTMIDCVSLVEWADKTVTF